MLCYVPPYLHDTVPSPRIAGYSRVARAVHEILLLHLALDQLVRICYDGGHHFGGSTDDHGYRCRLLGI